MRKLKIIVVVLFCCCLYAAEGFANSKVSTETEKTQVVLIGTIHSAHHKNPNYSPDVLKEIILSLKPDAILNELPLSLVDSNGRPLEKFRSKDGSCPENWAADEAAMKLGIKQIPFDRPDREVQRKKTNYYERSNQSGKLKDNWLKEIEKDDPKSIDLKIALIQYYAWRAQHHFWLNTAPELVNSEGLDLIVRIKDCVWEEILPTILEKYPQHKQYGDNISFLSSEWQERNAIMANNIVKAARQYLGKRLVVLTGATHRYILKDLLKDQKSIDLKEYWEVIGSTPTGVANAEQSAGSLTTFDGSKKGNIKDIAMSVAGSEGSTGDRAKKLVKWMNENFEWTSTDYKQRTVEEIIQRRGVPTTSGRYTGKPVQASGTHNYQAMLEYSIQAELLGMQGKIQGSEYVCFVNRMGSELDRLYCLFPLHEAELVSQDCSIELIKAPIMPEYLSDGRFFRLSLKSPIGIGQKQRLKIEFSGIIPPDEEYAAGAVSGNFWHPTLFALVPSEGKWPGWLELITPAIFEVALTVPSDHNVATSAQKVREYSRLPGCKTIEAYTKGDQFFKWRSSPAYQVATSKSSGGEIRVYFTDRESLQGPFIAEAASKVSSYYTELLGSFPFPLVSFVPGRLDVSGGGEAGPRMLMLHKMHMLPVPGQGKNLNPTRWIVAHELGHLYWSTMGYVEIREDVGWLALGLGQWTDQQYAERIGLKNIIQDNFRRYIAAAKAGYNTTIHQSKEQLKDAPFNVNHVIRHSKGFAVISMLEYLMGKERFLNFIKDILARYGGRTEVLTERKFILLAQDYSETDLSWFFDQWLDTNKSLDYGLEGVTKDRKQLQVEVRRLGEAIMPVCVQVVTEDGKVLRKRIQSQAELETVCFDELGSAWLEVILDPEQRLPDLNRSNNMVERSTSDIIQKG